MKRTELAATTQDSPAPTIDFSTINSIDEGCEKLAGFLGLNEAVSKDVFLSAVEDPTYARNLYIAKTEPAFVRQVLRRPTRRWSDRPSAAEGLSSERTSGELLSRAAKSFLKWTRNGFKKVESAVYRRRLAACAACPHHVERPATILYSIAGALTEGGRSQGEICDLCGCMTSSKARFDHESCPDRHPVDQGLTRWGEPLQE